MKSLYFIALIIIFSACSNNKFITIPTSEVMPKIEEAYTIVWVGTSEVYKYKDGQYIRTPNYDYTFEVVQRRYNNLWKSTKTMHRIHPEFPGNGKKQNKTMYFEVLFSLDQENIIIASIKSSEGGGNGTTDTEFREQKLTINLDISRMAPFNTMRLVQHYNYEEGTLIETVEIFKETNGKEFPFMKIEEKAYIFRPETMKKAPTTFQN